MPPTAANVTSIDAVRSLKAALGQFQEGARSALEQLSLEARRSVEWIEHDRTLYWPREVRKASDRLSEARIALERCELTINAEDRRACYDERKALERAKRRLELTEAKVAAVRRWKFQIHKGVEEFEVQVERLRSYLDHDLSQALAALERMAQALDRYVDQTGPSAPIQPAPKPTAEEQAE
jgi:exonuclease VII large subunit